MPTVLCKSGYSKKHNVECHFNTVHCGFNDNFPLGSKLQKKKICDVKTSISAQQKCLFVSKKSTL